LRRICDENDILLIFDEVQSGMGISGKTWCCTHFDVLPDLLVFGKKAQVCGVMAGPRLDEVKDNVFRLPSRINSTWGGNFCDYVRSTHFLRITEKESLVDNAREQGAYFSGGTAKICRETFRAHRGAGTGLAFGLRPPNRELRDRFWNGAFELGLLVLRCGDHSIRLRPVLDLQGSVIDEALKIIDGECRRLA